ncbi:hypothetical protein F5Y16DRAFT_365442 [Xylariaceae sp. FL0255]|nr:hypothetical protein F5Y16DRAFT_365442 [Xylariaceae sp. FL0255]
MNSLAVANFLPLLAGVSLDPPGPRQILLGGQNFTNCCLVALNESLVVQNGNLSYASPSFVDPTVSIENLEYASSHGQFPCGATYNGINTDFAPVVKVSYDWCNDRCSGWEISRFSVLAQWIGPLVQFIIPSLAFSTNIPRTRKLAIPDIVFKGHPRTLIGICTYWIRLLLAIILMTLDTFVCLSICFAVAGPMLLSAVYEYALDRKVLEFLSPPKGESPKIPMRLRAQLLIAVVVGNIRMATKEKALNIVNHILHDSAAGGDLESKSRTRIISPRLLHNSIWKRVMTMVDDYETVRSDGTHTQVVSLPTKLKSLLNSQASFGSTIGAPILFFVGGFIYTVIDSESSLGDNDTSHALAFGMWWMVIPYVAIVACAMLAANSPSTLDGIVYDGANTAAPDEYEKSFLAKQMQKARQYKPIGALLNVIKGYSPIETAFEGRFQTVKLWKRGLNKRQWVQEAVNEYEATITDDRLDKSISPEKLRKSLTLNAQDCSYVAVTAMFLLLAPNALAFITSYNTPRIGLSCRSLTYLIYSITQVGEMTLWCVAARQRIRHGSNWADVTPVVKAVTWYGQIFFGLFAIFAAVGGTTLQLLGVYRTCLCFVSPLPASCAFADFDLLTVGPDPDLLLNQTEQSRCHFSPELEQRSRY